MNRIDALFSTKESNILSVFFTAGYPRRDTTVEIAHALQLAGVDLIEIGMPFSDPMADGPIIQHSSKVALENGITIELLFSQLETLRAKVAIPVVLMGYFNPVLKFGVERFLKRCQECGVDGVIIPDMPLDVFDAQYAEAFSQYGIYNILLATPTAEPARIEMLAKQSQGFIYMVSSGVTTGGTLDAKRFEQLRTATSIANRYKPLLVGFGVSNHQDFDVAAQYGRGAVVGSAFVKMLEQSDNLTNDIKIFVKSIVG
ncbi:tryptophan synthase subunit alpha [Williamwhitmania taraxaci]|uniref:Tryptophan synthase alpha chain n=1 Tax=Williamwhitmania taraxaci TaxID=1640674 RepID=A0A1G6LQ70_9BACT|nr:tryptophan synthase subunit alpha [Williamwhitmania taraxaci]SDC44885.1 tryptophan synthase, alpha chain [Williamwhitmania taraxaci]